MYCLLPGQIALKFDQSDFQQRFHPQRELGSGTNDSAVCICMPNIINAMYIQQLTESLLPSVRNTVGICKQITSLIYYQVNSRLEILLKIYLCLYISL